MTQPTSVPTFSKEWFSHLAIETVNDIKIGFDCLGRTFSNLDGLDKLAKLVKAIGEFALYVIGPNGPVAILNSQLKTLTETIGALNLITRIKEWVLHNDRKKFINDGRALASKIMFTVASLFETVKFFDSTKLIHLGELAYTKVLVPGIEKVIAFSPIGLAKDVLVIVGTALNLSDSDNLIAKAQTDKRKATLDALEKFKWNTKNEALEMISNANAADLNDVIEDLKRPNNEHKAEYIHIRRQTETLKAGAGNERTVLQISNKWDRLVDSLNLDHGLARRDLLADRQTYWYNAETLHSATLTKQVISIVNDILKIAVIAAAIIGLTVLTLGGSAAFMIPFLTLGVAAAAMAYTHYLFGDWYKLKQTQVVDAALSTFRIAPPVEEPPFYKEAFVRAHEVQEALAPKYARV